MCGTTLFLAASPLPFAIWLMKNFMDGVPIALEEAAWTDGASALQTLRRIVLPLMGPGVVVVTIYTFIRMWGNFFVPFMLLLDPNSCRPRSASSPSSTRSTAECTTGSWLPSRSCTAYRWWCSIW